jgi:hypothetical protein
MSTRVSLAVGILSSGCYAHYIAHVKQHVLVTLFIQSTLSVYGIEKSINEFLMKQKVNLLAVDNGTQNDLKIKPDHSKHIPQQGQCSQKQIIDVSCAR